MFLSGNQRRKYVLDGSTNALFIDYTEMKYMSSKDKSKEAHRMPCSTQNNWDDNCIYESAGEKVGFSGCTSPWYTYCVVFAHKVNFLVLIFPNQRFLSCTG